MFDDERAQELTVAPSQTGHGSDPVEASPSNDHPATAPEAAPASRAASTRWTPRATGKPSGAAAAAWLRRHAVAATIAVVATALVGGLLGWNSGRIDDGAIADASHPTSTRAAGGSGAASSDRPGPSASIEPTETYRPLAGASAAPTALLTARGASGLVVPLDASFRLESTDGTPAATLAAGLTVEPAFAFSVRKQATNDAVLLAPARPLIAGALYRFALYGSGGQLLDTWAFQAKQPLRIVGTLPETRSSEVPLDTGIEITFDQDGVEDASSHVTIQPATPGRFEQHGRTLAFVPDRTLAASTLYTVTVTRGVKVTATGEETIVDTRLQFETQSAAGDEDAATTYEFPDEVTEASTSERPTLSIYAYRNMDAKPPTSTRIAVYRLAGIGAAIDAFRTLRARPDWTRWTATGLVDVTGLARVLSADLPLNPYRNGFWVRLPEPLAAGWYLVQQSDGTRPIQAVLQVTDVAGYLAISETKTIVWANDLRTGAPIAAATASSDGVRFARTDGSGLAVGATPKSLLPRTGATCARPCDPVVVVRTADGRQIFLPAATGHDKLEGDGGLYWWYESDATTWSLLHTDRSRYRPGDTVNLWGFVRDRDGGAVPSSVTIRLYSEPEGDEAGAPAVATVTRHPNRAGAFSGALPLTGLPDGYYRLTMAVGARVIRSTAIVIGPIAKPAYQLDVTTGRRVYIAGDHVTVTVRAHFFEGTPVPGVALHVRGFGEGSATTDSLGTAVYRTIATIDEELQEGPTTASIGAIPARAEEAEITAGSRDVVIFPSSRTIDAVGRIANGQVIVTGGVHLVAVKRLEASIGRGFSIWDLDPRGGAVRGATVSVTFYELVPSHKQIGTEYDFVEKKVVPVYDNEIHDREIRTIRVTTRADGSWTAAMPASLTDHGYRIAVRVGDPDGHVARATAFANRTASSPYDTNPEATLDVSTPTTNPDHLYGIGDRIDVRLTDPARRQATGDGTRYLFFTAQSGIRTATVQSSRRFVTAFPTWGAPNVSIGGVRFTGEGYVGTTWFGANFRITDRKLQVDLTTDAARYVPGGTVTVTVRTRSAGGAPVSATVILRAVDEKLFTIGAAETEDPLRELYAGLADGVLGTYRSHRDPVGQPEGGDTGGGGDDRDDFRDSLLFKAITTGADGRGSTSFHLSDDLTSWRVTASAVTARLQAGVGSVLVPVGLPFFVDASVAPEYLTADRPSIAVRTFGTAVAVGAPVTIRVTSPSLGFDSGPLSGTAFTTLDVPLPALHSGPQTLTITATTGSGASARTDRLTRSFQVVDTRLTRQRTTYVELPSSAPFAGGDGFTTVLVADASGGRYLALLTDLANGTSARLERALAADLAARLLKDRFGATDIVPDGEPFAAERYQGPDFGLGVVPYASSDLEASVLVAIVAPDRVNRISLASYLQTIRDSSGETRERRMFALAGLAGLGEAVLPTIRTAATDPDLTVREELMLGLGAARLGDSTTARAILDRVIKASGEQSGTLARLRVGTTAAEITAGTALAAALAAAVGDPLAPRFWAYVEANPAADQVNDLLAIAFVTSTLDRRPVQAARFAWTVAGDRHVVTLDAGASFRLVLTPVQLATLAIERLSGSVGVTTQWREAVRPTAFTDDPDLTISRSSSPLSTVHAADLVVVELAVTFTGQAANGCRQVTELVPSGLAPVGAWSRWSNPDEEEVPPDDGIILPYDQVGSRVFFCVEPTATRRAFTLRYVARVVTTGTYAWEPAVAQSGSDEGIANLTPVSSITIR